MVPRRDRREAALFRLQCQSRPKDSPLRVVGPHFDLQAVIDAWKAAIAVGDAAMFIDSDGKEQPGPWKAGFSRVRLEAVEIRAGKDGKFHSCVLLLSYANARAADPGRRDFKSDKINILKLGDDGGLDFGAHLVIGDVEIHGLVNSCKCVLEDMTGLGRARVISFLERLGEKHLKAADRPTWTHTPKNGPLKNKPADLLGRLRLASHAERSDNLQNLIKEGRLVGVKFVQAPKGKQFTDEFPAGLEPAEIELRATVKSTGSLTSAKKILADAAQFALKGGWQMRAEVEKEEAGETKRKVRRFDLEETDLEDQMFARRHPLEVNTGLPQCYESTDAKVVDALCQILDQPNLWT